MGIDIYLNGAEEFETRTASERLAFEAAVKRRDSLAKSDASGRAAAQSAVVEAHEKMWAGHNGYLRSSYNSDGLFTVLEEIFGVDAAAYLFPGPWENKVPIDGPEFVRKVQVLQRAAALALSRKKLELPWLNEFSEASGETAPYPHESRTSGEAFAQEVLALLSQTTSSVEPAPRDPSPGLEDRHTWYLTVGLSELVEFGRLAQRLNEQGVKTFAEISY